MNKYPKYKSSGVKWIGEIPEHWDFVKTNILTENLDGKRVPLNSEERGEMEGEYPYWGSNGIVDYVNKFIFNEDIVLVGEDGSPFFDKLKDVSFFVNEPVWVNNHIHVLKSRDIILPKFITYSFNCVDYKEYITGSTRDKLTQSDLKRISHCVPPLQEQLQIVQFLDNKTELIYKLISTKERKIDLLKSQRTSLINEVITKGLDPNVKMKNSVVEWIGEIPEHWISIKLKHVFKYKKGFPFKSEDMGDEGIPIVKVTDIKNLSINIPKDYFTKEVDNRITKIKEGDIVITTVGSKMEVSNSSVGQLGKVGKYHDGFLLNQNTLCIRLKDKDRNIDYIYYQLQTNNFRSHLDIHSHGTVNQSSLNVEDILNFTILVPQLNEQNEIVEYLDTRTKEIDELVSMEQKKIDLLKEYRQSLISEVITGKIDVRIKLN